MATFLFSKRLRGHFSMVDVQNATLAGGVAVGSTCNMMIHPGCVRTVPAIPPNESTDVFACMDSVALCIGLLAGTISTAGFARLQPFLAEAMDLQVSLQLYIYIYNPCT